MSIKTDAILLWIDDLRPAPGAGWTVARTSADAIRILATGRVQLVSFDHDLGGNDTGMRVVDWLDESATLDPTFMLPAWRVHSANPVGAARICAAMDALAGRRA